MDEEVKKGMLERFSKISILEVLRLVFPEVEKAMAGYVASQKNDFEGKLHNRIDKAEKLAFLKGEIEPLRTLLENDILSNAVNMVSSSNKEGMEKAFGFVENAPHLAHLMPTEQAHYVTNHLPQISNLLKSDANIEGDQLKGIFSVMPEIEAFSPALMKVIGSDDPLKQLGSLLILIQHQNEYLKYLISEYNRIENDVSTASTSFELSMEKIEWLGTQKELAELFVELKAKGWIKDLSNTQIKTAFTNSESVDQALKPFTDTKSGINLFSNIYTTNYKPSFSGIKTNSKPTKTKEKS